MSSPKIRFRLLLKERIFHMRLIYILVHTRVHLDTMSKHCLVRAFTACVYSNYSYKYRRDSGRIFDALVGRSWTSLMTYVDVLSSIHCSRQTRSTAACLGETYRCPFLLGQTTADYFLPFDCFTFDIRSTFPFVFVSWRWCLINTCSRWRHPPYSIRTSSTASLFY